MLPADVGTDFGSNAQTGAPSLDHRTRLAFVAETSRCPTDLLDYETALGTSRGPALPDFGTWCMEQRTRGPRSITPRGSQTE